MKSALSG